MFQRTKIVNFHGLMLERKVLKISGRGNSIQSGTKWVDIASQSVWIMEYPYIPHVPETQAQKTSDKYGVI